MIRAAMIGLGWWGRHMVNAVKGSTKLEIVRLTARRPDRHRDFSVETGISLLDDYQQVLEDPEVDAVILCTPHSQHEDQVYAAIDHGKQIFCEKPLSLTKASAERMVAAARKAGLVMGVGHERRFESTMEEITRLVTSGEIGTHMHAEANFSHEIFASLAADNWRGSKEEGPAVGMTGMGVHLTDLLISMLGPVEAVTAQTARRVLDLPTGDVVNVQLRFASGATGYVAAISATPYYGRFTVFGDRMWVEARDDSHPQHGGKTHLITCGKDGVQHTRTFDAKDPVRANLEEWADAVTNGAEYRFNDDQRVGNVAVLEAIAKSVENGTWVMV
ncbi:MAG: Gfo/Idh/MocA family oxidoreductase [Gammaproteobacteria bacterium]|nr:MAG: Gfo/Idh/MocA family oxidoreductase [Gammaproteobacteria bacterium]